MSKVGWMLWIYLASSRRTESEHISQGRDDVDCEANKEWPNGGVDGSEEGENDGQEPNGDDHGQPSSCALAHALAIVHSY